ncbi:hypothetical protein [Candidatus Magnetomonas plexicatena]|uniref:hypothetical protein n=1 Tax=Candidatus Magnetomonas plexicatena TaxID=2552947 RepID=UPI004032C49D
MKTNYIQYVSDDEGNVTAVIVPIEKWHELNSEETSAQPLINEKTDSQIMEAKKRTLLFLINEKPLGGIASWGETHRERTNAGFCRS